MSNDSIVKFRPFDKVEFDIVERIGKLVAFDNVAWTLLLVWTGLKTIRLTSMSIYRKDHEHGHTDIHTVIPHS